MIYEHYLYPVTVRITGNIKEFQGAIINDKNTVRLPRHSGGKSMQNAAYGGCVLQIKADIKIYTTTLTTKESSKVHMRNIYI